ncbi:MAG: mechanosensitive ion channel family protein [Myxococcales bacterium]|nr:mechanosensitive ion channel family protein [Myxococcales bacterium]MDH3483339.1 mechanosensitive ion channel family protein [Myxococcales bacterium]
MEYLNQTFFGNPVKTWLVALGVAVAVFVLLRLFQQFLVIWVGRLIKKTKTKWDDIFIHSLRNTKPLFLAILSLFAGAVVLELSDDVRAILWQIVMIAFLLQVGIWVSSGLMYWLRSYRQDQEDPASVMTMNALGFLARLALWSIVVLLILDNLGVDITALVAGLGIGGIAIGLAVQNILGDLFASLSIVLDKPFVLGDFIIVDDLMGSVESIGIKTTRVRSISGEQLVFSNSDLLDSRIRNYGRLYKRRVVFTLGVTYGTAKDKLEKIPEILREAIEAQDKAKFDRSHFASYGDFSLNFETVYFVMDSDYNLYMDIQQAINLAVYQRFAEEGIEFAFPTQTLFLNDGKT